MGKKYIYIDYNNLFVACTIFIAGFCLAVLSLLVNAPGIYPFLFMCGGASGLTVACLNQAKRENYSTECRSLLPTKICSYPQQGKAVLKYEGSEIKPLNANQRSSEREICCLIHPDLNLKPGNLTNSISKIQNNAEDASKNIITCIERDIEHHVDICHEQYTFTPSPGGSSSRKGKVSISEKSQRKRMPHFGTTLKRTVSKIPTSQFYVPSAETTALIPEESDSEEHHSNSGVRLSVEDGSDKDSEEQSRPSSSSDPIYENVDAYRAKQSEYSLESSTKQDFQNAEFQLSEVEENKLSCDQRALNVESTNSQGRSEVNKNRLKYRVGEFTSPERIYANILPPLLYIHEPAGAEHNIPKEIKSSIEDGNIHKTGQPLVKTLLQFKPEKCYSNKTPLEDCGRNGKSAKDFNSNILSYKDSPIKEAIATLPPGMQNMEDTFSRGISRDASTHKEIKVACCNRLHPRSPYKNTHPLQEGNKNLEVSDSPLGLTNTGSNPFKRYEERKSPESENVYENLPCYMLTMFQKFRENTLASFEEKNDLQSNTELQTVVTGSMTEKVGLAKQVRCDRVAVTETESTSKEHSIYSERDADFLKRKTATNSARSGLIHVNTKGSHSFTSVEEVEESDEGTCGDNISPKSCAFDSGSNVYEFDRKSYESGGSCLENEDARNFAGARSKKFTPHYSTSALEKLGNIPKMKSKSLTLKKQMPLKSVTLKRGNDYENVRRCTYNSSKDSQKHIDEHNEAKSAEMHLTKTAALKSSPIDIENTDRSLLQVTQSSLDKTFPACPTFDYSGEISPLKVPGRVENVFYPSYQSNIVGNKDDESSFSFKNILRGNLSKFGSSEHDSKREQSLNTNPFESNISRSADISAVTSQNPHPPLITHKVEDLYPKKNRESSARNILTSPNQSSFTRKSDNYLSFKKYLNECYQRSLNSESHSSDQTPVRTEKNILCTEFAKCSFTKTTDQSRPSQRYENQIFDTLSTGENYPPKIKPKRSPTEKKGFLTAAERSSNQSSFNLDRERTRVDNRQSHSQLLSVSKHFKTSPQKPVDSIIKSYFPVEDARESQNYAFYSELQLTDPRSNLSDEARAMKIQPVSPSYTKKEIGPNLTQDKLVVSHYDSPRKPVRCVESRTSQPSQAESRNKRRTDSGNSPQAGKIMSLEEFVKSYYDSPKELRRVGDELKNLKKTDSEIEKRIHSPERHEIITNIKSKVSPLRSPLKEARLGHYLSPPRIPPYDSHKELRRIGDELKNLKKNDSEIEKRIHSQERHEIFTNINKESSLRSPLKETRLERHYISPPRIKTPSPIISPLKSSSIGSEHSPLGTSLSFPKETSPNDGQARFSQDQFAISHYDSPSKLIRRVKFETSPTSPRGKGYEVQIDNSNSPQERKMLSFEEFMESYYDSPKKLQRIDEEMSNLEQRESEDNAIHSPDHQVISNMETKKSRSSLKDAKFQSDSISPGKIKTLPRILPPLNLSYAASSHSSLRVNETSEQLNAPVIENIYENVSSFRRIAQNDPDSSCSTDSSNVSCSNNSRINPDASSEISTAKRKLHFSVDKNASSGSPDHHGPS